MLYIFNQDDKFINILTEETGLVDTWFKDYQNHLIDEPFIFNVKSNSPLLEHIKEENQVAFYDRDNDLRLMRMKELYEVSTKDGHNIRVKCEPSFLELYDHFIEDKRITDGTAQTALNRSLEGSRYIGEVAVELGNATDNFYWIDGITAVFKILNTWGGALKDTITLNDENEITERKLLIMQRLGADNGLIVEPDHNAETISRNTLSYVETALWGQGASLETDNGGFTRYITFEDVEWKVSKGDPVDKPKGQKWVGDSQALADHGYLHNGTRKHRYGHYIDQTYETPEELLMATWQALQERKLKEIIHEATIYESDKKVSLGDTATILDRNYNKPIELQSQITGLEYDVLEPLEEIKIVVGKYIDMNEDPLEKDVEDLKNEVSKPKPSKPIDNDSFPDTKPGTPSNVEAVGMFRAIMISWDYDSAVYVSHYELYASQNADFVPDSQFLVYRGRVSATGHDVGSNETWYYRVRAVNTRGTASDYSDQVSASSTRIDFIDMKDEINQEVQDAKNQANQAVTNADLATQNATEAIEQAQEGFDKAQEALTTADGLTSRMFDVEGDISTLTQTTESFSTRVQDTENNISTLTQTAEGLQTQVSDNKGNITTVTQLANGMQSRLQDAEGNINTLTQTSSSMQSTIKGVRDDLDGLEIGGRNIFYNSSFFDGMRSWTRSNIKEYVINGNEITLTSQANGSWPRLHNKSESITKIKEGVKYVISFEFKGDSGGSSTCRISSTSGANVIFTYPAIPYTGEWQKFEYAFTSKNNADKDSQFEVWIDGNNTGVERTRSYRNFQLELGTLATDWTPAPEDVQSQITQLSDNINLRVEKGDTITQINLDGRNGNVLIEGRNLILDGDTTVNGTFRVKNANIASVDAGKMTTGTLDAGRVNVINISASNINSGTIDTDLLMVRGGSSTNYTIINGSQIESRGRFTRTWRGTTKVHDIKIRHQNGYLRARNDSEDRSLYFSDNGISTAIDGSLNDSASGTLEFFDTQFSTARGVTLHSHYGVVALQSNSERVVISPQITSRSGTNDFSFRVKNNSWENSDGYISFGDITTATYNSGLRFSKDSRSYTIYATNGNGDIGTGNFDADTFRGTLVPRGTNNYLRAPLTRFVRPGSSTTNYADIQFAHAMANTIRVNDSGANFYIGTSTGEVRITDNGLSSGGYRPIRVAELKFGGSGNFYTMVNSGTELRVTNQNGYNDGNTSYQTIRAGGFTQASSRKYKKDIESLTESSLDVINKLNAVSYTLKDDDTHAIGFIAEDSPSIASADNQAIISYTLLTHNTKAIQELDTKIDDEVSALRKDNENLLLKVAKLESKIIELERVA